MNRHSRVSLISDPVKQNRQTGVPNAGRIPSQDIITDKRSISFVRLFILHRVSKLLQGFESLTAAIFLFSNPT